DVRDARTRLAQPGQRRRLLARPERGVEAQDLHPEHLELVVLVLHQRDERRHHQRGAGELERGELIAQRLAAAGGHDRERVLPVEDVPDRKLLTGAERADAEAPARLLVELAGQRLGAQPRVSRFGHGWRTCNETWWHARTMLRVRSDVS